MNGDPAGYAQAEPWREARRNARMVRKDEPTDPTEPVRPKLDLDNSQFRALEGQVNRDKKVKRSCKRMLSSIKVAKRRIGHASRRRTSAEAVNQDMKEFAKRIRAMRKHADRVNKQMSPDSPFDTLKLDIDFAGGDVDRKKCKDVVVVLDAFAGTAESMRSDITSRKKVFKRKQRGRRNTTW